ncbi:MAG: chloramphenicol acetyltransferase [Bacilli bacterium]|nr:chloramphenicol acetyltransferase [Bacilli bacterium]
MNYKIVDFKNWKRKNLYEDYLKGSRMSFSITSRIEVTNLIEIHGKTGLKFYPLMIYCIGKIFNSREEFRYGYDEEGNLIIFDFISPSIADFHPEQEEFVKYVVPWNENLKEFHDTYLSLHEKYLHEPYFYQRDVKNIFNATCLPWIDYEAMDTVSHNNEINFSPFVCWGKYIEKDGHYYISLTLEVNHLVADGFHASRFFLELQKTIDSFFAGE